MNLSPDLFSTLALLALLGMASYVDLLEHRIPNRLVLVGLIVAISLAASTAGRDGVVACLTGVATGAALLLPYYVLGGMGAGDVKLMAMAGGFLGARLTVAAVLATLLSGVVIGFVMLLVWRTAHSTLFYRLTSGVFTSRSVHRPEVESGPEAPGLPYGVAILIGVCLALIWNLTNSAAVMS